MALQLSTSCCWILMMMVALHNSCASAAAAFVPATYSYSTSTKKNKREACRALVASSHLCIWEQQQHEHGVVDASALSLSSFRLEAWSDVTTSDTTTSTTITTTTTSTAITTITTFTTTTITTTTSVDVVDTHTEGTTSIVPLSVFGTKDYWDDVYAGRGDFPAAEYSWYYGWNELKRHVDPHMVVVNKNGNDDDTAATSNNILLPGIGNDPLLTDLVNAGYRRITAQDYSQHAVERQLDLLEYCDTRGCSIQLSCSNVKRLPAEWNESFDVVLEKGLLDAVYLSGEGHVEAAVASLAATLKKGGIFVSVSGVIPDALRRSLFAENDDDDTTGTTVHHHHWEWLRDGSLDLKAGCFIFRKI